MGGEEGEPGENHVNLLHPNVVTYVMLSHMSQGDVVRLANRPQNSTIVQPHTKSARIWPDMKEREKKRWTESQRLISHCEVRGRDIPARLAINRRHHRSKCLYCNQRSDCNQQLLRWSANLGEEEMEKCKALSSAKFKIISTATFMVKSRWYNLLSLNASMSISTSFHCIALTTISYDYY